MSEETESLRGTCATFKHFEAVQAKIRASERTTLVKLCKNSSVFKFYAMKSMEKQLNRNQKRDCGRLESVDSL